LYNPILFDLDGTLTDPKLGITRSVAYALRHFGIEVADCDSLVNFIGPPLRDSFRQFYGFSDEQAETAVAKYREYFSETGIFENTPYDGMPELLQKLKGAGRTLAIATSKPWVYAEKIAERFGFAEYFDFIAGAELDGARSEKSELISYALERLGVSDKRGAVMIGDREFDMRGAAQLGIDGIGILWGYGTRDELLAAGATRVTGSFAELETLL
jgi:phosphoglycolate phosphatase